MKKSIVVVGAGLCGSLLATLLRNDFEVTLVEQAERPRPLYDDIDCTTGELNTSINRAAGLGGTTRYWHNALIELDERDLAKAGYAAAEFAPYYRKAWSLFLTDDELAECARACDANRARFSPSGTKLAHLVLPRRRHSVWELANARHPGAQIAVVFGRAERIAAPANGARGWVEVAAGKEPLRLQADYVVCCAGGLATPVLLARSLELTDALCDGYHDHPMAYVAKLRLRPDSLLKAVACATTRTAEVRAGVVYEHDDLKTVLYLRPAIDMNLASITGPARYILSDLRNDPWSPRKLLQLLGNLDAVREAILFKTKQGFRGDVFSLLVLGEQEALGTRGLQLRPQRLPSLNWHVSARELRSYRESVERFLHDHAADIVEHRVLPPTRWEFRNAAHHSGTARRFVAPPRDFGLGAFEVTGLPRTFVCDGSLLRAAGIANTGLSLVALCYRLAELLCENTAR